MAVSSLVLQQAQWICTRVRWVLDPGPAACAGCSLLPALLRVLQLLPQPHALLPLALLLYKQCSLAWRTLTWAL